MANRRMFSKSVVETDRFLDLPLDVQAVYFHLGMCADDDGFVESPRRVCRVCGCDETILDELEAAGYIYRFNSGVIVVVDWRTNNQIRADRYTQTHCINELQEISEDNGKYIWQPDGNQMETKGKPSTEQIREEQIRSEQNNPEQNRVYSAQELVDICKHEHIKLNAAQIASFISEMQKTNWLYDGLPIQSIGAVLRKYSSSKEQKMKSVFDGSLLGFND